MHCEVSTHQRSTGTPRERETEGWRPTGCGAVDGEMSGEFLKRLILKSDQIATCSASDDVLIRLRRFLTSQWPLIRRCKITFAIACADPFDPLQILSLADPGTIANRLKRKRPVEGTTDDVNACLLSKPEQAVNSI